MKVVLFCGGLGTRLREYTGEIPKPMVKIGYRPILWHLMKYYAHFGHKDFVLCLGYKGDVIKEFFLRYEEWISNDFTLSQGGKHLELENNDIEDWNITFVDTGSALQHRPAACPRCAGTWRTRRCFSPTTPTGYRHGPHAMIEHFRASEKIATFVAAPPSQSFHLVDLEASGDVTSLRPVS